MGLTINRLNGAKDVFREDSSKKYSLEDFLMKAVIFKLTPETLANFVEEGIFTEEEAQIIYQNLNYGSFSDMLDILDNEND